MRALLLLPDRDVDGHDYTGAFRTEMDRGVRVLGLPPETLQEIDVSQDHAGRRRQVLDALRNAPGPLDLVGFCCHGTRRGLQLGFGLPQAGELAAALAAAGTSRLAVVLWACSTAKDAPGQAGTCGDGGFADVLRDLLFSCIAADGQPWRGHVDGHDRAGHCCSNPYVRRMSAPSGQGGDWIVAPGSALWPKWEAALKDRGDPPEKHAALRFRFPLMSVDEIRLGLEPVAT